MIQFEKYQIPRLILALLLFWIPVILFVNIADEIVEREPIGIDAALLSGLSSIRQPILDAVFLFFTTIGNVEFILPISIVIFAFLLYKKKRRNALLFAFGIGGAAGANAVLKLLFQRDRPDLWQSFITETGYSFPSGHSMVSCALILSLIVILWNTRFRVLALILGSFIILMIGLSRVYFGVHFPSDILAGWSFSLVWVLIVTAIVKGVSYFKKPLKSQRL